MRLHVTKCRHGVCNNTATVAPAIQFRATHQGRRVWVHVELSLPLCHEHLSNRPHDYLTEQSWWALYLLLTGRGCTDLDARTLRVVAVPYSYRAANRAALL